MDIPGVDGAVARANRAGALNVDHLQMDEFRDCIDGRSNLVNRDIAVLGFDHGAMGRRHPDVAKLIPHLRRALDIGNIDPTLYTDSLLGTTPSTALTNAASYTIHLEDNTNAQTSEKVTFNINETCSKYNEVRVHFLNRLGGYDAFNFYLKSIHQTDIKKDKYDQQHHDWNGWTYDYTKKSRGATDYNVSLNKKLTVNTDYLTEEESLWMEDLITSPSAYIEESNELIAVNLDARRIQRKTSLNDKLMQYTFELNYSIKNRRQRG